ncbi:hypothetical protein CU097_015442 [Rhizopus azygosporus]|uniref:Uncharacterized protein n=1 Tax=Rhizopus azygosporus TaxID=86630 RepID=A0A367KA04_RHIAZ|nr:hypothetical protein CU097_015442 [Rhizopus azygosporus]
MSTKENNGQKEDTTQEDPNRFQSVDDQKLREYNDNSHTPLLSKSLSAQTNSSASSNSRRMRPDNDFAPKKGKRPYPMLRVDQLSVQDIQAILMENYSLRQEIEIMSHQFHVERMNLQRRLRHIMARNQYLEEMRWSSKKRHRQKQESLAEDLRKHLPERRKSFSDVDGSGPVYRDDHPYLVYRDMRPFDDGYYNDDEDEHPESMIDQDEELDDNDLDDDNVRYYKPLKHHPFPLSHPPPPPPHPNFGPMPPPPPHHIGYPPPHHQHPPPQPWMMNDMPYDLPPLYRKRSKSKGRFIPNEDEHHENEESILHMMHQMALGPPPPIPMPPPQSPLVPPMVSIHNNNRRRKSSSYI